MSQRSIFVTGATGNQGQGVVRHCLTATSFVVYAMVRDPFSPESQSLKSSGAIIVRGNLDDETSLLSAFQETRPTALFINTPPGPGSQLLSRARNLISAAQATPSIKSVIHSSSAGVGRHTSFPGWGPELPSYDYWVAKDEIENLVRGAGFENWTIVRLATFLQLFVPPLSNHLFPELWSGPGGKRVLRTALKPKTKIDLVNGSDVGAVVAKVLSSPEAYRERVVDLAVEALTASELAEKISKSKGEPVEVVYEEEDELAKKLGPGGERLVAAQKMFNVLGCYIDVEKHRQEFRMTGVEEFFTKAQG
ncbi:hypothetical protein JX265_007286 [Neoarthrinium moseri]|uniref:NmrA-like domain-containing protein n=1 Tax=Neoarthrinium moseri TaxID=1658444 RepID=A0A9Q0ANM2_9PEZI|nr:hypothetical protein JX265_007286 [Neoarthrinium moseri]